MQQTAPQISDEILSQIKLEFGNMKSGELPYETFEQIVRSHKLRIHLEEASSGRCMDCDGLIAKHNLYVETKLIREWINGQLTDGVRTSKYLGSYWEQCSCTVR